MFRMSFDQHMAKTIEENSLFVFMCAHVSSLRTQLAFMHMHT